MGRQARVEALARMEQVADAEIAEAPVLSRVQNDSDSDMTDEENREEEEAELERRLVAEARATTTKDPARKALYNKVREKNVL